MGLIIRKKITLDNLGEDYKEAYLQFKSIPVGDLPAIQKELPKEGDSEEQKLQSIPTIMNILKKYFLDGKFPDEAGKLEDVTRNDLDNLDQDAALHCFEGLTGVSSNLEQGSGNSSTPSTPTE